MNHPELADLPSSLHPLRTTALLEAVHRSRGNTFLLLGFWVVLAYLGDLYANQPWFAWLNTVGFLLVAVLRALLERRIEPLVLRRPRFAHHAYVIFALLGIIQWGTVATLAFLWPPLEPIKTPLLLVAIGYIAASTPAAAVLPALRLLLPTLPCLPFMLMLALDFRAANAIHAFHLLLFQAYIISASGVVLQDFRRREENRRQLAEQARDYWQLSNIDGLTGLNNRLYFDRQFEAEWERARRQGSPIAVLLIDLDHFKTVNDRHGHLVGDCCLREAAAALAAEVRRAGDVLARYGGEEFIVLLPFTDTPGAEALARRLAEAVRRLRVEHEGVTLQLTCSIGLASTIPGADEPRQQLLEQADQALYRAKASGRDRVEPAGAVSESMAQA